MEADMTGPLSQISRRAMASTIALALVGGLAAGCGSSGGSSSSSSTTTPSLTSAPDLAPIHGTYSPSINPADFVATINNRYWPLKPGTTFHYKGIRGKTPQIDNETVTHQTKQILGIKCTVVRDTVSQHGAPIERTFDWYAQDKAGNVWYMGEDSLEKKHGHFVKASDSWESGVKGGKPGIIMPGNPQPGDQYRQEYYPPGQALDQARVLGRGSVNVPYGAYKRALVTSEFSPLEPQTENKYYVAGVGEVAERVVKGHHEQFQLVSVTH
jgi:hypothetical protein